MTNKLEQKKKDFLTSLRREIKKDEQLQKDTISIILFGSFLNKNWQPKRSDIDIFCYTHHKKASHRAFDKVLQILKKLNDKHSLYPHHEIRGINKVIEKIEEEEEYLLVVPFHFVGFHIIVFSREGYDYKTGEIKTFFLKVFSRLVSVPIFLDNVHSEYEVISGFDLVRQAKSKKPNKKIVFRICKLILLYSLPLLLIKPRSALAWFLKASRVAYKNFLSFEHMQHTHINLNQSTQKHIAKTNQLRSEYHEMQKLGLVKIFKYYQDSWRFIKSLERKIK